MKTENPALSTSVLCGVKFRPNVLYIAVFLVVALCSGCIEAGIGAESVAVGGSSDRRIGGPPFLVLGLGQMPEYEGADTTQTVPLIVARTQLYHVPLEITGPVARLGLVQKDGFMAGPAIGYTGPRDADVSDSRVARLTPKKASLDLGLFALWRQAINRFSEGVLEIGATALHSHGDWGGTRFVGNSEFSWAATRTWRLAVGTSVSFMDNTYAEDRFGVSVGDARVSSLDSYELTGGVKDIGASFRSVLSFSPKLGLFTLVTYSRLLDDAAKSPIVADSGTRHQTFIGAGLFMLFNR